MLKTVKNMWAMSKPLTVLTIIAALALLFVLGVIWWIPVYFGYPWYCIVGNLLTTGIVAVVGWFMAEIVNG